MASNDTGDDPIASVGRGRDDGGPRRVSFFDPDTNGNEDVQKDCAIPTSNDYTEDDLDIETQDDDLGDISEHNPGMDISIDKEEDLLPSVDCRKWGPSRVISGAKDLTKD